MREMISECNHVYHSSRRALHDVLGIPNANFETPLLAPKTIRIDRLWQKAPPDLVIPHDKEIFLGFDYENAMQGVVCSEVTCGTDRSFSPRNRNHFVWLHTEPATQRKDLEVAIGRFKLHTTNARELFAYNFPRPYWCDMIDMISNPEIYASVIIRLSPEGGSHAALMAIKTKSFRNDTLHLYLQLFKDTPVNSKHLIAHELREDEIVTKECGIAIYRGFVGIPPSDKDILRLRRF